MELRRSNPQTCRFQAHVHTHKSRTPFASTNTLTHPPTHAPARTHTPTHLAHARAHTPRGHTRPHTHTHAHRPHRILPPVRHFPEVGVERGAVLSAAARVVRALPVQDPVPPLTAARNLRDKQRQSDRVTHSHTLLTAACNL